MKRYCETDVKVRIHATFIHNFEFSSAVGTLRRRLTEILKSFAVGTLKQAGIQRELAGGVRIWRNELQKNVE